MKPSSYSQAKAILRFEGTDAVAYWRRFVALLTMSVIVATMGLLRDSAAVVIAAMLIAPLMSPILGIASAILVGWTKRSFVLLGIVLAAAAASVFLAYCMVWLADVPRGILLPSQVRARTDPGIEELAVALTAGAAGAYVQINRNEISLLPGAAIGVSLVPPLSTAGILIYFGETTGAWEAFLLFLTNLSAIVLSAGAVYVIAAGREGRRVRRRRLAHLSFGFVITIIVLTAIVVQLTRATIERFTEIRYEAGVASAIKEWAGPVSVEIIRIDVDVASQVADVWIIADLPISAMTSDAPVSELIPARLRERPLWNVVSEVMGPDFTLYIRFNPRIAGAIDAKTGWFSAVPPK